ncbi:Tll0287-like domain-containing protein [Brumimicrobium aurantiacum]|uniref:DUF3365 domain-containing protein n=1 Tax=Brumimicrobium aurantiacum TaxID=1737063 RepID=A0A3E1F0J8_9FLAO|nr:DUF3365 domain-containing protein [Brumimicrobium aurantiacum]RFC55336.1 DUF3365 domain-containing protein [Brumimicrobium aurantiacum]
MKIIIVLALSILTFSSCGLDSGNKNESSNTVEHESITELTKAEKDEYIELGKSYSSSTQQVLGKNLIGALSKQGSIGALEFCNIQAIPLTDSMQNKMGVKISRISDQPRNQDNKASEQELAIIKDFKSQIASGKIAPEISPVLIEEENKVRFYAPIVTNAMCLQCHGVKETDIKPETLEMIAELYPQDKATGYKSNEVRGVWSIIFER